MNFSKKWLIGSGTAVLLAGGIYGGTALAQSASPSSSPSASAKPNASARAAAAQQAETNFIQHLASRLNISTDQVTTALKAAAKDSVADRVKAGSITQQQADQVDSRIDSGQFPLGFAGRPGPKGAGGPWPNGKGQGGPRGFFNPGTVINAAAGALNMQPSDLMSQLRSGKTLQDVATAQNVDFSKVTTAITNAVKPGLDQAVASGKLTQQRETDILTRITNGQFPGPRGGARPAGRPGRGPAPSGPASPSPSASA
jgi:hypothetical protein